MKLHLNKGVYSCQGENFSNQFSWGRESKRCLKLHASFGDILHTFIHIVTNILIIPNYLPLLFLCIFKILASLHIICIPSLLFFKMLNFMHEIWARRLKKITRWAGGKFQSPLNYINPFVY